MWWLYFAITFLICWIICQIISISFVNDPNSKGLKTTYYVFLILSIILILFAAFGIFVEIRNQRRKIGLINHKTCKNGEFICEK